MNSTFKAACGQFQPEFGETAKNIRRMTKIVRAVQADLIVFPELCTSGYELRNREEVRSLALNIDSSEEFRLLKSLAKEMNSHIVFGFPEISGSKLFNSSALIEPNGTVTPYRKLHLFDREKNIFDPGEEVPPVIDTAIGKIGLMICFDWIFPEVARSLALRGSQIICHPSNLVLTFCQRAMFARSVENGVFTMTCNRIGSETRTDRTLTFTGASQILSNRGVTMAQASPDSEEVISAEIDLSQAVNKMITAKNNLFEDRRTEMYTSLWK